MRHDTRAELNLQQGEFEIKAGGWYRDVQIIDGDLAVELASPTHHEEPFKATVACDVSDLSPDDVVQVMRLLTVASNIAELINEHNADTITKNEIEKAEIEQREHDEKVVRDELISKRRDALLNELMGDTVRVRHSGYRTTAKATVEHQEHGEDEFRPYLRWHQQGNYNRRRTDIENWKRFDLKTDKGWKTVWDDGADDVAGAKLPDVKPWSGGLC